MNTLNFNVSGLNCEACVKLITNRLQKIVGVVDVNIDFKTGNTQVTGPAELNLDQIKQSLAGTTYQITV